MLTMYEKLMTLPMFKGIGTEQVSSFLEKTHLDFITYNNGDHIISSGEPCKGLTCVLSGNIEVEFIITGGILRIIAGYGPGKVLGLDHLFGMNTNYSYFVRAIDQCGTMFIAKKQYLDLVNENHICLINFLNYLSYQSQRVDMSIRHIYSTGLTERLAQTISLLTNRECAYIRVEGLKEYMEGLSMVERDVCLREIGEFLDNNCVREETEGDMDTLIIPSRSEFLDFAESKEIL